MDKITTITPEEAVERLRAAGVFVGPQIVRAGIQQKVFPFGDCIVTDNGSRRFLVYSSLLERWITERAGR